MSYDAWKTTEPTDSSLFACECSEEECCGPCEREARNFAADCADERMAAEDEAAEAATPIPF